MTFADGAGIEQDVKSVKAEQWTLAWDALAPCNLSDWHSAASSRCAFPDNIQGSWNQTQVYACPTILTLARFNRVWWLEETNNDEVCCLDDFLGALSTLEAILTDVCTVWWSSISPTSHIPHHASCMNTAQLSIAYRHSLCDICMTRERPLRGGLQPHLVVHDRERVRKYCACCNAMQSFKGFSQCVECSCHLYACHQTHPTTPSSATMICSDVL